MPWELDPIPDGPTSPDLRAAKWTVTVAPVGRPVTWADAKAHAIIEVDADQAYVEMLIDAATDYAEHAMNTSLLPRTILATFYDGDELRLPRGPLIEVLSVADADAEPVTDYTIRHVGRATMLATTAARPLNVTYRAGYANAAAIPAAMRIAILTHVATLYRTRESVADKQLTAVPHSLEAIYRRFKRGAGVR